MTKVRIGSGDHPRVCGEHLTHLLEKGHEQGSSPRMRGARLAVLRDKLRAGIIPAYAGSTSVCQWGHTKNEDHPRVCGEHLGHGVNETIYEGSSPRMRGALCLPSRPRTFLGIIPAYAGSTLRGGAWPRAVRDHPRVCGEHALGAAAIPAAAGSSPRMRGAPPERPRAHRRRGIIPAYAGSTHRM